MVGYADSLEGDGNETRNLEHPSLRLVVPNHGSKGLVQQGLLKTSPRARYVLPTVSVPSLAHTWMLCL